MNADNSYSKTVLNDVTSSDLELTDDERRAVRRLKNLAKTWPKSLLIFGGTGALTVRKPAPGKLYDERYIVATIEGIPNDGGDGGREWDE